MRMMTKAQARAEYQRRQKRLRKVKAKPKRASLKDEPGVTITLDADEWSIQPTEQTYETQA